MAQPDPRAEWAVLLFYQYVAPWWSDGEAQQMIVWLEAAVRGHALDGRVRVATEGLNGNLTGSLADCRRFVATCRTEKPAAFEATDFKMSATPHADRFRGVKVWKVDEICALGIDESTRRELDAERRGGVHLAPNAFHELLVDAAAGASEKPVVLLDCRNCYETAIGRLVPPPPPPADSGAPSKVVFVDPETRHFSDMPGWFERNAAELRDKKVLMYCTGGVRCERASALLRASGVDDVSQLSGGIERYLESFPAGGLFQGKNYVFDRRGVVGAPDAPAQPAIGACVLCRQPWDKYKKRRCGTCKTLVLVCMDCCSRGRDSAEGLACGLSGCRAQQIAQGE